MKRLLCGTVVILSGAFALHAQTGAPAAKFDAAMRAFWDAADTGDAEKAARQVVASGATVDEIHARLKAGRPYTRQKTGRVELPSRDQGIALDNIVEIPAD